MLDRERRYRETLDHLLEGFQIIGRDWRYIYVNPAAATQGSSSPAELEGKTMAEAYPGIETSPLFVTLERCMSERVGERLENHFQYADGTTRWFELRIEPVPEGLCIHSLDIEERKRAEAALQAANSDLERRVAERTAELQVANQELDAFSYAVAHDLRGPLRGIDGFAQLLLEDCGDELSETGKRHLARVRGGAQRMAALIDDLLGLSRITRAGVVRQEVDLTAMAHAVATALEEREPQRRVSWQIDDGLRAHCDPGLARIVLENLLANAWKFTARAENPTVRIRASDDGATVVIEDNGAGFDMAHAQGLFSPFQRLHTESEFPGTGIGLATVARIVRKHDGFVRAEGIVGRGTTVTFSLSRAAVTPRA